MLIVRLHYEVAAFGVTVVIYFKAARVRSKSSQVPVYTLDYSLYDLTASAGKCYQSESFVCGFSLDAT